CPQVGGRDGSHRATWFCGLMLDGLLGHTESVYAPRVPPCVLDSKRFDGVREAPNASTDGSRLCFSSDFNGRTRVRPCSTRSLIYFPPGSARFPSHSRPSSSPVGTAMTSVRWPMRSCAPGRPPRTSRG